MTDRPTQARSEPLGRCLARYSDCQALVVMAAACACWCPDSGGSWHPACPGGRDVVDCRACLLQGHDDRGEDVGGEVEPGLGEFAELGELLVGDGHLEGAQNTQFRIRTGRRRPAPDRRRCAPAGRWGRITHRDGLTQKRCAGDECRQPRVQSLPASVAHLRYQPRWRCPFAARWFDISSADARP
jgi:hypothetical protein